MSPAGGRLASYRTTEPSSKSSLMPERQVPYSRAPQCGMKNGRRHRDSSGGRLVKDGRPVRPGDDELLAGPGLPCGARPLRPRMARERARPGGRRAGAGSSKRRRRCAGIPEDPPRSAPAAREENLGPLEVEILALADLPSSANDLLGFRDYATAIAEFIRSPETRTPLTIAIDAPWAWADNAHALESGSSSTRRQPLLPAARRERRQPLRGASPRNSASPIHHGNRSGFQPVPDGLVQRLEV